MKTIKAAQALLLSIVMVAVGLESPTATAAAITVHSPTSTVLGREPVLEAYAPATTGTGQLYVQPDGIDSQSNNTFFREANVQLAKSSLGSNSLSVTRHCINTEGKEAIYPSDLTADNSTNLICLGKDSTYYGSAMLSTDEIPVGNFKVDVSFSLPQNTTRKGIRRSIYLINDSESCEAGGGYAVFDAFELYSPRVDTYSTTEIGCNGASMQSYTGLDAPISAGRHKLSIEVFDTTISYYLDDELIGMHTRDRLAAKYPQAMADYDAAFTHPFRLVVSTGVSNQLGGLYPRISDEDNILSQNFLINSIRTYVETNIPEDYQSRYNTLAYTRYSFPELYGEDVPDSEVNQLRGPLGTSILPFDTVTTTTSTVTTTTTQVAQVEETTTPTQTVEQTTTATATATATVTTTNTHTEESTARVTTTIADNASTEPATTSTSAAQEPANGVLRWTKHLGWLFFILAILASVGVSVANVPVGSSH
ncbi:MAG: hypothetical protein Q3972_05225 [Corynebacterium sp.]|nr:hypothetical protein [Corynebacterium sp.]